VSENQAVSLVEAVAERLRRCILGGEIAPGAYVSEATLSTRFDVPRPTVRSALLIVTNDGLLRREPNRSAYVPRLSRSDVADLFAVRRLVELEAVTRLVTARIHPTAATQTLRIMEALDHDEGWDEVVRLDVMLHQQLVDAIGSPRLSRIYASISTEFQLALTQLRASYTSATQVAAEHRELLDAICSNDLVVAAAMARDHIDEGEKIILDVLAGRSNASRARGRSASEWGR
jgi:DNA-binding GntR family transcriptional regulator